MGDFAQKKSEQEIKLVHSLQKSILPAGFFLGSSSLFPLAGLGAPAIEPVGGVGAEGLEDLNHDHQQDNGHIQHQVHPALIAVVDGQTAQAAAADGRRHSAIP